MGVMVGMSVPGGGAGKFVLPLSGSVVNPRRTALAEPIPTGENAEIPGVTLWPLKNRLSA
jgi:hypothetical protein